jgi:Uma2 family endonuclease
MRLALAAAANRSRSNSTRTCAMPSAVLPVSTIQTPSDEIDYPVEEKLGQGKNHEVRFTELLSFLRVLFAREKEYIIGGDRFFYYEKGKRNKSVAPDAFVIKHFQGEEPDAFKLWETPIDLRFACEIWSAQNNEAERHCKFAVYRDVLKAKEYAELTDDERLFVYRLNDEGDYEQLVPNEHGRFFLQELNAELVFEDGLIRIYKDGKKIPTLKEALTNR